MSKKLLSAILCISMAVAMFTGCGKASDQASSDVNTIGAYESVSADALKEALTDNATVVVDARTNGAFSGWAAGENKMGGHIDGATDFSANWLTCTFDDKNNLNGMTREEHLEKYMDDKKITTDTQVIVYDENGKDAAAVADYFSGKGVKNIKLFSLPEWKEALVSDANYQLYLPPVVVNDLIQGKQIPEIGKVKDLKVLEVSWGTTKESGYLDGHVPGAFHVNSDDFDDENNFYLLESDEVLFDLAKSLGITTESTVVCTGLPIFSARMAIILNYLGVDNVYVMSGGTTGWADAGFELENTEAKPIAVSDFGTSSAKNPDLIDTVSEVQEKIKDSGFLLVDNRTLEEYRGESSGYSYFDKAGRIEGAVYGYAGIGNSSSMLYYTNLDTTMRNVNEILAMWKDAGVDTGKHLSFYCGGGYRAAEILWDAKVMGLEKVSIFADGWCGWASAGLPSITGE